LFDEFPLPFELPELGFAGSSVPHTARAEAAIKTNIKRIVFFSIAELPNASSQTRTLPARTTI